MWEYNGVKERHPDDMVLYQMGDFFEIYGEDAKEAAPELGLQLVSRAIPGGGRVEMCGFPANRLEQYLEQLRAKHDVTVSATLEGSTQRREYSVLSIDHEAEQDINAHEAEYGADGFRAFRDEEAIQAATLRELHEQYKPIVLEAVTQDIRYRNACGHSDYENAVIEGNAAIRRAVLGSGNMGLLRLYSDTPEFLQLAYSLLQLSFSGSNCVGKAAPAHIPGEDLLLLRRCLPGGFLQVFQQLDCLDIGLELGLGAAFAQVIVSDMEILGGAAQIGLVFLIRGFLGSLTLGEVCHSPFT